MSKIPYGRQEISQSDIDAVIAVLRSDFLTQGPTVPLFEKKISDYCGSQYAIAVNSATSALHIACLALGVGGGDAVWTTPITFVASANCALYCGAMVDFVDIDPRTFNISVTHLAEKLALAKKIGQLPKVVIVVHMGGQPCDMVRIRALGEEYDFKIIEDASHAIGAKYAGAQVGNCLYSDITVFSFHPVKIITTGEGGMAITNDATLAKNMRMLRSHGITTNEADMDHRPTDQIWNYQQKILGFNYRMTDLQAALGLNQIERVDTFVSKRHAIARRYDELLTKMPVLTPWQHSNSYSSYHLYIIRLNLEDINKSHLQVYEQLHSAGILVNLHYIPVYLQPLYAAMGFKTGHCPEAEKYFLEAITLPMYPGLTELQQDLVVDALHTALIM